MTSKAKASYQRPQAAVLATRLPEPRRVRQMRAAFGFSVDEFLFYGGYPGAAPLIDEPQRYVIDSLIETSIARDVLLLTRVDKPARRRLFELACRYSGQVLSYTKMLGQLQDAGNTVTLAGECALHYWREGNKEVGFIVKMGRWLTAIEVKSGRAPLAHSGTAAFAKAHKPQRTLLVGGDGIALEDFLTQPVAHWAGAGHG
ncbi:MAG: hypothetical protein WC997_10585 [Porticoccaceae bacterium]